jgi:sodium/hydrogen antiporter
MESALFAYVAGCVLLYALVSEPLRKVSLTAAIFFFLTGLPAGAFGLGLLGSDSMDGTYLLAEITLALVLFVDATHASPADVVRPRGAPLRLLLLGLPLVVVVGTVAAKVFLPGLSLWEAAVLATIVAPTDAALGQPMLEDKRVPRDIRHILNVESGLNDGLSVPILLILLCVARSDAHPDMAGYWIGFSASQLILGPLTGALVGYAGTKLLLLASPQRSEQEIQNRIGIVAVAILSYGLAELVHGNGLIACFVAGLVSGKVARRPQLTSFADAEGKLLAGLVFFVVGAQLLPAAWENVNLSTVGFAIAVLTFARMVPATLTLIGTHLGIKAIVAIGWFGPRGIATIVFALVVERMAEWEGREVVFSAAVTTVALSILLHGATAIPAVNWLAKATGSHDDSRRIPR